MKEKTDLARAWVNFLDQIDRTREYVGCTTSAAWFRGHCDSEWTLTPSLTRYKSVDDIDDKDEIERRVELIRVRSLDWKQKLTEKTRLKKDLQSRIGLPNQAEISSLYKKVAEESVQAKQRIADAERDLTRYRSPVRGERELFDEFVFRAGKSHDDASWQILAEMRHYGIPTRLLDWTDRLDIALYFSLESFANCIAEIDDYKDQLDATSKLPNPCIWVLNPYNLSKRVTGRTSIWDIAREYSFDYYKRIFIERNWPFELPIPIYPPARIERIRAQRGYFTVFGNKKMAMDEMVANRTRCLQKVSISWDAAIFYVKYLLNVQGLSKFEIYRDMDSLGQELTRKFARMGSRDGIR